jgi:integrase
VVALPKFLSLGDVDALIAQPDVPDARPGDRAMIELLYATGMRVSELVGVRGADLHVGERYLTCVGKGNKERLVPMGDQASDWVERYQREGRPALAKARGVRPSPRLFLNARGAPLSRVGFWKILKKYGRQANLPMLSPHVIRHYLPHLRGTRRRPSRHSNDAGHSTCPRPKSTRTRSRPACGRSTTGSIHGRDSAKLNRFCTRYVAFGFPRRGSWQAAWRD